MGKLKGFFLTLDLLTASSLFILVILSLTVLVFNQSLSETAPLVSYKLAESIAISLNNNGDLDVIAQTYDSEGAANADLRARILLEQLGIEDIGVKLTLQLYASDGITLIDEVSVQRRSLKQDKFSYSLPVVLDSTISNFGIVTVVVGI